VVFFESLVLTTKTARGGVSKRGRGLFIVSTADVVGAAARPLAKDGQKWPTFAFSSLHRATVNIWQADPLAQRSRTPSQSITDVGQRPIQSA
jgi:hypothetical protein